MLEHRNNASWSIINAGHGEFHASILCYDTFAKGRFTVLNIPDMPSEIYALPTQVLTCIRQELDVAGVWIDAPAGISLFTYDNDSFGVYCYTWDGCCPVDFDIHVKGEAEKLVRIQDSDRPNPWTSFPLEPVCTRRIDFRSEEKETVFHLRILPGDFAFFEIKRCG